MGCTTRSGFLFLAVVAGCAGDGSTAGLGGRDAAGRSDAGTEPGTPGEPDAGGDTPIIDPIFPADGFCGEPGASWAFCEDFDGRGAGGPTPIDLAGTALDYSLFDHGRIEGVSCEVSGDCAPYFQGGAMLTNAEDSGFGWSAIRLTQPFDFAGREGHIRFTSNLNFTARMNLGVILSPLATNAMPDNRRFADEGTPGDGPKIGALNRAPALAIKSFRTWDGGAREVADVQLWNRGDEIQYLGVEGEHVIGPDRTLTHEVDVYVTRTHIRMLVDGATILDRDMVDVGFDRAYVYLAALSYNAMKEDLTPKTREANTALWDNIAFDGLSLAPNSLTPDGYQDVVFRAHAVSGCTVKGVAAEGPFNSFYQNLWAGWTARVPLDAGTITAADITCSLNDWPRDGSEPQWGHIEIVRR